jgi:hypothetical protein
MNDLRSFKIQALDGDLGGVHDFFFDDADWTARYMVVDTGTWLPGRRVLISPVSIGTAHWSNKKIDVRLTKEQVKGSPDADTDMPVSRQLESQINAYYGWPMYWQLGGVAVRDSAREGSGVAVLDAETRTGNIHLHSASAVEGYYIHANDGEIGHVEDFLVDDNTWMIRYMVVDTRNWIPGKKVLVAPQWVRSIDAANSRVHVDMTRASIKNSPEFDMSSLDRSYEQRLHDYYGKDYYWI